jgi:hypothetical protein
LKPFDLSCGWDEGLGLGKIYGGKDWFRVGVDVLVMFMDLGMGIG